MASKQVAKIVHYGLRRLHAALVGAYARMLATWRVGRIYEASPTCCKKLSISAVGVNKKLRRLSSVGSHFIFVAVWEEKLYLTNPREPVTTKSQVSGMDHVGVCR
jgi:hypothetical protein